MAKSCIGLYIFPRYQMKTIRDPADNDASENQLAAKPQYESSAHGNDESHQRREPCLQAARAQRDLNTLHAFFLQPALLIVFARKCFDDTDGRQHLLQWEAISLSFFRTSRDAFLLDACTNT